MLFSLNELKRIAGLKDTVTVEEVVNAINSIGFEVEEYNQFSSVKGVKFGRIISIEKNPNADKLNVCRIEFDNKERTIQTNASNVYVSQIVVAFVPGSQIGDIVFDAKELKGIVSEGMLSSPSEFGIAKDLVRESVIAGIASYDEIEDLSIDPVKYLGLDDFIIDIDILTNRSDANSYYVMALELAAYFGTQAIIPEMKEGNLNSEIKVKNGLAKSLVMVEADIDKLSVKEQIFLNKHNVKSVNDAADLSNLVLLYTGQPTHAYDMDDNLNNFKAVTRSGKINIFGNKVVKLEEDLVISANDEIVSVASVIGVEKFATKETTNKVLFELGIFENASVRKAVKSVKLNTNASSQGSKALSLGTTELALRYLSNKLSNFSKPINFTAPKYSEVDYNSKTINMYAGFDISKDDKFNKAINSLKSLGFVLETDKVTVPNYRHDVELMVDIIEEIFRFYGYDHFGSKKPSVNSIKVTRSEVYQMQTTLSSMNYQEIKTYSLISQEKNIFNPFYFNNDVVLETYVSKEREVIRNSQTFSLMEVAEYNIKRGMKDISIFSYGMINDSKQSIAALSTIKSFDQIKKEISSLVGNVEFKRLDNDKYHPGVSAHVVKDGQVIGFIGKVHPSFISFDAFIFELLTPFAKVSANYQKYSEKPLKFEDVNIETNDDAFELIKEKQPESTFSTKVIDEYIDVKGDRKITVRYVKEDK